jgi:hypothetical protein
VRRRAYFFMSWSRCRDSRSNSCLPLRDPVRVTLFAFATGESCRLLDQFADVVAQDRS